MFNLTECFYLFLNHWEFALGTFLVLTMLIELYVVPSRIKAKNQKWVAEQLTIKASEKSLPKYY